MYKKHVIIWGLQDLNVKQGMRWLHALGFLGGSFKGEAVQNAAVRLNGGQALSRSATSCELHPGSFVC